MRIVHPALHPKYSARLHRNPHGTLLLTVSKAAAVLAGGEGHYAVGVREGESLVLIKAKSQAAYTLPLRVYPSTARVSLGRVEPREPWLAEFAGHTYEVEPVEGGIRVHLWNNAADPAWSVGQYTQNAQLTAEPSNN